MQVFVTSLSQAQALAAIQKGFFNFSNGNQALYELGVVDTAVVSQTEENPEAGQAKPKKKKGYRLSFVRKDAEDQPEVLKESTENLKRIEIHADSDGEKTVFPKNINVRYSHDADSTFTWYEDAKGKYFVFEDGTFEVYTAPQGSESEAWTPSLGWKSVSARLVQSSEEKYIVASYQLDGGGSSTEILRLSDKKSLRLDDQFHALLHKSATTFTVSDGVLSIDGVKARVDLKTLELAGDIIFEGERYQLKTVSDENEEIRGTFLVRMRDQAKLRLDFRALPYLNLADGKYDLKDGILAIPGVTKKVDLKVFDSELRRFNRLRVPEPVRDKNNIEIDAVSSVNKNYKDLVQASKEHPEDFVEKSDPEVIEQLGEAVRGKRSAVVLGKAGTGKSASIRAFARDVGLGLVPGVPRTMQIFEVRMASLASGTTYTGMIEERIQTLVAAAQKTGCIYFVDELHSMTGIGTSKDQPNDVTQYIKDPLARGQMLILGTDTQDEFETAFGGDPAFMDRFPVQIKIAPPKGKTLLEILKAFVKRDHDTVPEEKVLEKTVEISDEFNLHTAQPRAGVNLLSRAYDKMGSRGLEGQAPDHSALNAAAKAEYGFDPAYNNREVRLEKLAKLEKGLNERILGHAEPKSAVVNVWRMKFHGVGDNKHVNSILFVGAPGIGKTYIAETSAELMGYEKTTIEMQKYAGGGVEDFRKEVYEAVRKNQFRLIILDEIEKAHSVVQEAALSILQSGEFTVKVKRGQGSVNLDVNARHALFILTTNAATDVPFFDITQKGDKDARAALVAGGISKPIVSRIQYVIPMKNPNRQEFEKGIRFHLAQTLKRESEKHHAKFTLVDQEGYVQVMAKTHEENSDYREIERMMIKIQEKIAQALDDSSFKEGEEVFLKWDESFKPRKSKPSENPLVI